MTARAMIVVGAGSSTRFGEDKLTANIDGRPLIAHTLDAVLEHVDICVVVTRPELADAISLSHPDVAITGGGATRTLSEMAGLAALGGEADIVGIHDGARPVVRPFLIDRLFTIAATIGGAVPVLDPDRLIIDRETHQPVVGLKGAQTPQVFRGPDLMAAYVRAAQSGFEGPDTAAVMRRYSDVTIVGVRGDRDNVKVTLPGDLDVVAATIRARAHT